MSSARFHHRDPSPPLPNPLPRRGGEGTCEDEQFMHFNLSDRSQLELTGNDRARFLHGFCTNDIKGLQPGGGCEAFVCNVQGKVLGHIFVFCTESALWIDTVPGQEDGLFAHLDRYLINENVQIHKRTTEFGEIYVDLESAADIARLLGIADADEAFPAALLSHVTLTYEGSMIHIRRVDWLGEPGWLISGPQAVLDQLLSTFPEPLAENWDALRIAAGFPHYGRDITSENLAQEVNRTARAISFKKGCYLGQEPIARIDALGHVNRELHRLEIIGSAVPAAGTPLLDPQAGTQVGVITSAAAKSAGMVVALGYLRTKFCSAGSQVAISINSGSATATVLADLPPC